MFKELFTTALLNEKSNAKIDKVIVKGLERYLVQGSENGEPFIITSNGKKYKGKDFFSYEMKDSDYFKTRKEAEKYI